MRDRGRPLAIVRGSHAVPPCPRIVASTPRTSDAAGAHPPTVRFSVRENPQDTHVAAALGEQAGPRGGIEALYLLGIDFAQRP
jgi:hypothetical protein